MARRAAISPATAGLPGGRRRRTPGLRREELASLAGIGVTWYTWLEQGRDIRVSPQTLSRIAHALRLTPSDTTYLFSLAGVPGYELARGSAGIDPDIQRVIDGFQSGPAIFAGPCFDVEGFNRLADLVFEFKRYSGPFARNQIWRFFMDPYRRAKYLNWEALAEIAVGGMRTGYAQMLGDPYAESLVRELCAGSETFRRYWHAQHTRPLESVRISMRLPKHGAVHFTSVRFRPDYSPRQAPCFVASGRREKRADNGGAH
jgi:transcriptional regulator with XRE-family HTH domain